MPRTSEQKKQDVRTILKRLRQSRGLTTRQAAGLVGVSHVAISQFENGKLDLPAYRIEQMHSAYGMSEEDFCKISGMTPVNDPAEECRRMLLALDERQLDLLFKFLKILKQMSQR